MRRSLLSVMTGAALAGTVIAGTVVAINVDTDSNYSLHGADFGDSVEKQLAGQSRSLFGIKKVLDENSKPDIDRRPGQSGDDLVFSAGGLDVEIFSRDVAHKWDMMAFWPNEKHPTHLVACIEESTRQEIGTYANGRVKYNPSIQTIDLQSREIRTVLRGMSGCDGIRRTPWGTILATEEDGSTDGDGHLGGAYELLDPLAFEEGSLVARQASDVIDPDGELIEAVVAYRGALPSVAWEGLTVLDSGVVIAGDELRPGDWDLAEDGGNDPDVDGGTIFKFVPQLVHRGGAVSKLNESPLVAGSVYALRVSCREGGSDAFTVNYGQGCEIGNASWVPVNAASARRDAANNGATGYYRPEDLHRDPTYDGEGVRFCWANTGHEAARNYGEVICGVDSKPLTAAADQATVVLNRFTEGNTDFTSSDNLAFQPGTGNLYVLEDHPNGDVWACLPDGVDRDTRTDGCVKILRLKDRSAEPTGFIFTPDGKAAFVNLQHSDDPEDGSMHRDDWGTDDLLLITGFELR